MMATNLKQLMHDTVLKTLKDNLRTSLDNVGQDVRTAIIRRTLAGRDIFGQSFAPYSPSSAFTGIPDLLEGGDMLSGISIDSRGSNQYGQKIAVRANSPLAAIHQFGWTHHGKNKTKVPPRMWFGLSRAQDRRIAAKHVKRIEDVVVDNFGRFSLRLDIKARL
jgi:phage gpG-like protein